MTVRLRRDAASAGQDSSCLVVMYHYVRDTSATPFPEIRALAPELFGRQLDWLQTHYNVIDVSALEAAIDNGGSLPTNAALLTFDDGLVDHYEVVLPLLRERGLRGTFFVSADACGASPRLLTVHKMHFLIARLGADVFARAVLDQCSALTTRTTTRELLGRDGWEEAQVRSIKHLISHELPFAEADRVLDALFARHIGDAEAFARGLYLNRTMIREMAAERMTFGHHTRSHRMLVRLAAPDQEEEVRGGVEWIRSLTGQATVPFCYPWGGPRTYTADTVRIVRECGYSLAFNTVRRRVQRGDNRYELPRIDTRDLPPHTAAEPLPASGVLSEDA